MDGLQNNFRLSSWNAKPRRPISVLLVVFYPPTPSSLPMAKIERQYNHLELLSPARLREEGSFKES